MGSVLFFWGIEQAGSPIFLSFGVRVTLKYFSHPLPCARLGYSGSLRHLLEALEATRIQTNPLAGLMYVIENAVCPQRPIPTGRLLKRGSWEKETFVPACAGSATRDLAWVSFCIVFGLRV